MATRTLTRLFDNHADAAATVQALEAAGFSHDDVSIVASNNDTRYTTGTPAGSSGANTQAAAEEGATGAGTGATLGTVLGGGAGLLAGIGALAIPGVGPVVAAGWLIATLTGAGVGAAVVGGVGGLVGSLTHAGVPEQDAHVYAEGVRRGGSLVTVRVDETRAAEAEGILNGRSHVDPTARRTQYASEGWERFDETRGAYTTPGAGSARTSSGTTGLAPQTTLNNP